MHNRAMSFISLISEEARSKSIVCSEFYEFPLPFSIPAPCSCFQRILAYLPVVSYIVATSLSVDICIKLQPTGSCDVRYNYCCLHVATQLLASQCKSSIIGDAHFRLKLLQLSLRFVRIFLHWITGVFQECVIVRTTFLLMAILNLLFISLCL